MGQFVKKVGHFLSQTFKEDGKPDARSITNFWFVVLATVVVFSIIGLTTKVVWDPKEATEQSIEAAQVLIQLCYPLFGMILLLFGVVTAKQITALRNIKNG
jgi:hypothetical protein